VIRQLQLKLQQKFEWVDGLAMLVQGLLRQDHWTCWKEAFDACAIVGKPTLAMLVPGDDSNVDSERLASAHRTEGVRSALRATASSRPIA
jgi:hypothetical protein